MKCVFPTLVKLFCLSKAWHVLLDISCNLGSEIRGRGDLSRRLVCLSTRLLFSGLGCWERRNGDVQVCSQKLAEGKWGNDNTADTVQIGFVRLLTKHCPPLVFACHLSLHFFSFRSLSATFFVFVSPLSCETLINGKHISLSLLIYLHFYKTLRWSIHFPTR